MKKLLFLLLAIVPFLSYADHGAGADIFYKHVSGNTYTIYVSIFHNCAGGSLSSLLSGQPQVNVIDSSAPGVARHFSTISLDLITDSTRNANPYCESYKDSTNCGRGTLPGYTRYLYAGNVTLPYTATKWMFRFTSSMNAGSCGGRIGRANTISILNYATTNIILEATLNNSVNPNSSALAMNNNFPVVCVNAPSSVSMKYVDPNQDSLYYELRPGLSMPSSSSNCNLAPLLLAYATGYRYDLPFGANSPNFSYNNNNGTIGFTPVNTGGYSVTTRVSEYKNGVLAGTSMREQVFNVTNRCAAAVLNSGIDTTNAILEGAVYTAQDTITTCAGNIVKFQIPVSNTAGDVIKATINGIPAGSNITVADNNTSKPVAYFTWNTVGVSPGYYLLTTTFTPRVCPLPTSSGKTYVIHVADPGNIRASITSHTSCFYKAEVQYDITDGAKPYTVELFQNGIPVKKETNSTGQITDSLETGDYMVRLTSNGIPCTKEVNFTIRDSGQYPFPPTVDSPDVYSFCRNYDSVINLHARHDSLATLRWYDANGSAGSEAPTPPTNQSGTFYYTVSQYYKTCESARDTITIIIDQNDCDYAPKVYNVITPNGDGKNDQWVVHNLNYYPKAVVQVYNKLGDKVFESTNYQNDWTGDDLPSGVYYYLIRLNGINKTNGVDLFKGYLMIKR